VIDFAALFAFCDLHASRWRLWRPSDPFTALTTWDLQPRMFDRQGFPIPAIKGQPRVSAILHMATLMENFYYKNVALNELPDGSVLYTSWLGMDHAHFGGPPLFFETMRFPDTGDASPLEFPEPETGDMIDQLRYGSEEEALAGHHEIVRRIRVREGH